MARRVCTRARPPSEASMGRTSWMACGRVVTMVEDTGCWLRGGGRRARPCGRGPCGVDPARQGGRWGRPLALLLSRVAGSAWHGCYPPVALASVLEVATDGQILTVISMVHRRAGGQGPGRAS